MKRMIDDSILTNIANTIRLKTGTEETYQDIEMSQGIESVYNAGYEKGKIEGGGLLDYTTTLEFGHQYFDAEVVEIVFGAKVKGRAPSCPGFFSTSGMKYLKVDFSGECEECTISYDSKFRFYTDKHEDTLEIVELPIIEKFLPNSLNRAFQDRNKLKEIRATIDATHCTSFSNGGLMCPLLEEIRFKPNTIYVNISLGACSCLSDGSIQSIIDGLANLTGQTARTITLHAEVKTRLTEEQISAITSKNWTLA